MFGGVFSASAEKLAKKITRKIRDDWQSEIGAAVAVGNRKTEKNPKQTGEIRCFVQPLNLSTTLPT